MDGGLQHVQETGIKTIPKKKKFKKAKWLSKKALQIYEKGSKKQRKGKIFPFECRVPKNRQERYESLPQLSMQRNGVKQQNGKD